ncbi:MAG: ATP-binding protein [Kiritimatiellae bacterium]|nr:ATP-binding protein [Kiritimatiellia bacterium]
MEESDIRLLLDTSSRLIDEVSFDFRRYLCPQIEWNDRLICIKGPKGCGKTTLILQHIKETFGAGDDRAVYLSLDHIWFASHDVLDAVEWLYAHGCTHLFLDEVHHAEHWARLVKTIHDSYPKLNLVFSGSSVLQLTAARADLSRRQAVYNLEGLSFREFLEFEEGVKFSPVSIEDVVSRHRVMALEMVRRRKILPLFEEYLKRGYYPFGKEAKSQFGQRLVSVVGTVLDVDFPKVVDVSAATVRKTKKMLMILASSCPQTPNMSELYAELETDRNAGIKMFDVLEKAELVVSEPIKGKNAKLKRLGVAEKLFLGDTNLMYALMSNPDIGAVRETFFANQLRAAGLDFAIPPDGDFKVMNRWLFEIGGRGKGFSQIKNLPDSYVVNDGVELGIGNKIPLWLFGFLY